MKLFQIYESDLGILERALPILQEALMRGGVVTEPSVQVALSECKEIVSNVRWDYGPPSEVERIDG